MTTEHWKRSMSSIHEGSRTEDEGWGWDVLGSEDEVSDNHTSADNLKQVEVESDKTEKVVERKMGKVQSGSNMKGIIASPSFQELEKAIGATIAMSLSDGIDATENKAASPQSNSMRSSGTNLMHHKVNHQRLRQQQNNYNPHFYHRSNSSNKLQQLAENVLITTKKELSSFINEVESRALIIFHSPNVSSSILREECSKYGVLYYIRPEFHSKGVTFISYFDLQASKSAKESLSNCFHPDHDMSVHYSIMLHATNSNTEEYKLVVSNLPSNGGVETDVQSIFSRYGPLKSIEKSFDDASCNPSYSIEYFNIQDARLAASELSATSHTIWGSDAIVKFAALDDRKKQLCKQLLNTLSKWRNETSFLISQQPPTSSSPVSNVSSSNESKSYIPPKQQKMLNPQVFPIYPSVPYNFHPNTPYEPLFNGQQSIQQTTIAPIHPLGYGFPAFIPHPPLSYMQPVAEHHPIQQHSYLDYTNSNGMMFDRSSNNNHQPAQDHLNFAQQQDLPINSTGKGYWIFHFRCKE